jgi:hypothetical protein
MKRKLDPQTIPVRTNCTVIETGLMVAGGTGGTGRVGEGIGVVTPRL